MAEVEVRHDADPSSVLPNPSPLQCNNLEVVLEYGGCGVKKINEVLGSYSESIKFRYS